MHGDKVAGAVKKAKDTRHLDRVASGGYKAKASNAKKKGGGGKSAEGDVQEVKGEWTKRTDPDTGVPYWENGKTGETQGRIRTRRVE